MRHGRIFATTFLSTAVLCDPIGLGRLFSAYFSPKQIPEQKEKKQLGLKMIKTSLASACRARWPVTNQ